MIPYLGKGLLSLRDWARGIKANILFRLSTNVTTFSRHLSLKLFTYDNEPDTCHMEDKWLECKLAYKRKCLQRQASDI